MDVPGTNGLVPGQLVVGISPSSNGQERMDVPGTRGLVPMQLKVDISLSSTGRERMDVPLNDTIKIRRNKIVCMI